MARYRRRGGWAPYVSVADRRLKAEREIANLKRQGESVSPVTIDGRKISKTFWGSAWCDNLESYLDYESRLPRGRSCVRHGLVLDLQIGQGEIKALISGSTIYHVNITIDEVKRTKWRAICSDCSKGVDSLIELLQGNFSKGVMERVCQQGAGLFPSPAEIHMTCTCPDHASMCKHVAGALYAVGARLDQEPEFLFRLRGVNADEMIAQADASKSASISEVDADRVLVEQDLSELFGLDMSDGPDDGTTAGDDQERRSG